MLLFLVWLDRAFHFLANQYKCTNSPATNSLLSLICRYWDIIFFVFSANASMSTIKSVANTLLEQHLAFLKLMCVVATLSSNSFLSLHQCRYQIGPWSTLIFYQNAFNWLSSYSNNFSVFKNKDFSTLHKASTINRGFTQI